MIYFRYLRKVASDFETQSRRDWSGISSIFSALSVTLRFDPLQPGITCG